MPEEAEKGFFLREFRSLSENRFAGIIHSGDEADTADYYKALSKELAFKANSEHQRVMPYFFLFDGPSNSKCGIFALQTLGNSAIRGTFLKEILNSLRMIYDNYTVEANVIYVGQLFINDWLKRASLRQIQVTRYRSSGDVADKNRKTFKGDILVSNLRNKDVFPKHWLSDILTSFRGNKDGIASVPNTVKGIVNEALGISFEDDQEISEANIVVDIGGYQRTIPLMRPGGFGTRIDITEDIEYKSNSIPDFESIKNKSLEIIKNSIRSRKLISD